MAQWNDSFHEYTAVQMALHQSSDLHSIVELEAFPRHIGVVTFSVLLAITEDLGAAFVWAVGTWLVLRIFRGVFWRWRIHRRNIWVWFAFVRVMFIRWPIVLGCGLVLWMRAPQVFQQTWLWMVAILAIDIVLTFLIEARGHARATLTRVELETDKRRLLEESKAAEARSTAQRDTEDASSGHATTPIGKIDDSTPAGYLDDSDGETKPIELRRIHDQQGGNRSELEQKVKQRLYRTMSFPDLTERVQEILKTDAHSLDAMYVIAAEDIQFNVRVSQISGAETAGLNSHNDWVAWLVEKELEQINESYSSTGPTLEATFFDSGIAQGRSSDIINMIEEISRLREKGILTEEEFQIKKAELLDRL